jgi:hypothetical protein
MVAFFLLPGTRALSARQEQQQEQNTGVLRSAQNDDVKRMKPITEVIMALISETGH